MTTNQKQTEPSADAKLIASAIKEAAALIVAAINTAAEDQCEAMGKIAGCIESVYVALDEVLASEIPGACEEEY